MTVTLWLGILSVMDTAGVEGGGAVEVTDGLLVNNAHGRPQSVTNPDLLTQDDRGLATT